MTEQEYINATDLQKIRAAKNLLIEVFPINSTIIDLHEMSDIIVILSRWEEGLYKKIKINH